MGRLVGHKIGSRTFTSGLSREDFVGYILGDWMNSKWYKRLNNLWLYLVQRTVEHSR